MRELDFTTEQNLAQAFEEIKDCFEPNVDMLVEQDIEKSLGAMLQVEVQQQLGAGLYERTLERTGYRCGSRRRQLVTTKGTYQLQVPRSRDVPLRFRLFEHYRRLWRHEPPRFFRRLGYVTPTTMAGVS